MRRGTGSRGASSQRLLHSQDERDHTGRLDLVLLAGFHVLERRVLVADDRDEARAQAVGLLQLALQRAVGELDLRAPAGVS
jgi:hypothetical protein